VLTATRAGSPRLPGSRRAERSRTKPNPTAPRVLSAMLRSAAPNPTPAFRFALQNAAARPARCPAAPRAPRPRGCCRRSRLCNGETEIWQVTHVSKHRQKEKD